MLSRLVKKYRHMTW